MLKAEILLLAILSSANYYYNASYGTVFNLKIVFAKIINEKLKETSLFMS